MKFYCSDKLEFDSQWGLFWQYAMREDWSVNPGQKISSRHQGFYIVTSNDEIEDECVKYKNLWILADEMDVRFYSSQERGLKVFRINPESSDDWEDFSNFLQHHSIREKIAKKHRETINYFKAEENLDLKKTEFVFDDIVQFFARLKDIDFNADSLEIVENLNRLKKSLKFLNEINFYLDSDIESLGDNVHLCKSSQTQFCVGFEGNKYEKFLASIMVTYALDSIFIFSQNFPIQNSDVPILFQHAMQITDPIALMTEKGDLLYYNDAFSKLKFLPSDCLNLGNDQIVEVNQQFFIFKKYSVEINNLNSYYIFFLPQKENKNDVHERKTPEELGIISSSIAHELNNPIAGIIAASTVLDLEEWDEDSRQSIKEIKASATRCKQLIEIFLGFSRLAPHSGKIQNQGAIEQSFEQATQLLRFRMMESSVKIEIKFHPSLEIFQMPVNSSVLAMIVYLVLTELLTCYEHIKLVEGRKNDSEPLLINVTEFTTQFSMQLDRLFDFKTRIGQSKLIAHLLEHENLEIKFLSREIKIQKKNF